MKQLASYWTDFRGILYWVFLENKSRKFSFHYNPTRIMDTLHEDPFIFMIISRSVFLRVRNVSEKSCRENNIHFIFNFFFRKYGGKILYRRAGAIWRMHISWWLPKATRSHTHTHAHTLCNNYCFSTVTSVTPRFLNVTWYVRT